MFFSDKYLKSNTYSGSYLVDGFFSTNSAVPPCEDLLDFYYSYAQIKTSEVVDKIDGVYILEITDEFGVKLADGAELIDGNYVKFKENYPTLVANDTTNVFFDIGGNAKIVAIADLETSMNNQYFFSLTTDRKILRIGLYSQDMSGEECYQRILDFFNVHIPYLVYNDITLEYDFYITDGLIYNVKGQ